jgi:hypothetical protein
MNLSKLFENRWFRRLLGTFITLITLYVVLVQWVNWWGGKELRDAMEALEVEGETLDFRSVIPPPPPDKRNFCAIPALENIAHEEQGRAQRDRLDQLVLAQDRNQDSPPFRRGALMGEAADLTQWVKHLSEDQPETPAAAATRLLELLESDTAIVEDLLGSLDRPDAAWTPSWKTRELPDNLFAISLPHYHSVRHLSKTLAVLCLAEIELEHADRAHGLLLVQLRLARAMLRDPFLVGALVGVAQLEMANQCLWALCKRRLGTSAQFQSLVAELDRIDLHTTLLRAYRSELTAGANTIQSLKSDGNFLKQMAPLGEGAPTFWAMIPFGPFSAGSGLLDANAAALMRKEFEFLIRPLRDGEPIYNEQIQVMHAEMSENRGFRPHRFLAELILPSVTRIAASLSCAQGTHALARQACHVEANFADQGRYPESIPTDVSGMRYERSGERYRLWLPGLDGEDDGGQRFLREKRPERTQFGSEDYQGDWVWDYPPE